MSEKLAPGPEQFRAMSAAAADFLAEYYQTLEGRAIIVPTTANFLQERLQEPLPRDGSEFPTLMSEVRDVIFQFNRHNGHPRFFGYVASPGTAVTAVGNMITSALNLNVTAWRSAPAGTALELLTIDWLKEILQYPAEAGGLLTSGGSMANFAALGAARSAKAGVDVVRDGVAAVGRRMCLYVSSEAHFSIAKAAGMLGLGEANVRAVKIDESLRMDVSDLARLVEADQAAGHLPFCVVASAGTTATGAMDPLAEIAAFAREHDLWMHVDAAYGGFAAMAPSVRHLFEGIEQADSVTLDPHKWLYLPVGCGCVLYKDASFARAAFSHRSDYVRTIGFERDEAFAFWDYGPELTRPFRALDLWLLIKFVGADRLAKAIEENIACARYFEELVGGSDDFEMLAPVELSIFCFRYKAFDNKGNERLLVALNRAGSSYLSNATIRGQFALRGCVLNYRTTKADMERLLEDVRSTARQLAADKR